MVTEEMKKVKISIGFCFLQLKKYKEVMQVMLPTLGKERQTDYSPFMPVKNGRVLQKRNRAIDKYVEESCESCDSCCLGNKEFIISCGSSVGSIPLNAFAFKVLLLKGLRVVYH